MDEADDRDREENKPRQSGQRTTTNTQTTPFNAHAVMNNAGAKLSIWFLVSHQL